MTELHFEGTVLYQYRRADGFELEVLGDTHKVVVGPRPGTGIVFRQGASAESGITVEDGAWLMRHHDELYLGADIDELLAQQLGRRKARRLRRGLHLVRDALR